MTRISFKNKKVIIFDLDGTIVNLTANWTALKDKLIKMYQQQYEENCDFKRISKCLENIVEKEDEDVLNRFFEIIRQYELENIQDTQLIEETIYFINNKNRFGLKEDTKFAVLSLNTRNSIIKALRLANVYDKIDFIVGREDVRKWKPAPDGILKIEKHFKLKKEEMIYFGDLESDILTGQNAGVETFLIDDLIKLINNKNVRSK
ncbi:MAG: HAD family hydrolase [Candidatus Thorarchaeota archaeon]